MSSKELKAREAGIEVRTHQSDYRTPCPSCSPNRRKKKDPCLHITITREAIQWFCFHCDFKGAASDDDDRRAPRPGADRRPNAPQQPKRWW